MGRLLRAATLMVLFALTVFPSLTRAQTCDLNATTSNFSSQLAAANPGQTLCLEAGNYGNFAGVSKSSPGVTITPASGVSQSSVTLSLSLCNDATVQWIILNNVKVTGGLICGPTKNFTIQNSAITAEIDVWQNAANNACSSCPAMNNNNVLFTNDVFTAPANPTGSFGGDLVFPNSGSNDPSPAGLVVTNSIFEGPGCNDGVDIFSGGRGVTIGPGNTFENLQQGSCGNHVDPIQFDGSDKPGPTITGNLFINNSTGIASYDGSNDATVTNNVVMETTQDWIDAVGFDSNSVFSHNTVIGGTIACNNTHEGNPCQAQLINNIASNFSNCGGCTGGGTPAPTAYSNNLCTSGSCITLGSVNCTSCLSGTPTYVGGSNPSTYAGFQLTSGSLGHAAASDGNDIGINVSGTSTSQPAPPTGLLATVE